MRCCNSTQRRVKQQRAANGKNMTALLIDKYAFIQLRDDQGLPLSGEDKQTHLRCTGMHLRLRTQEENFSKALMCANSEELLKSKKPLALSDRIFEVLDDVKVSMVAGKMLLLRTRVM